MIKLLKKPLSPFKKFNLISKVQLRSFNQEGLAYVLYFSRYWCLLQVSVSKLFTDKLIFDLLKSI